MHWIARSVPPGVRHPRAHRSRDRAARARGPTSSTRPACSGELVQGRSLARTPYVLKLTADPAFERARRRGLVDGSTSRSSSGCAGRPRSLRAAAARDVRASAGRPRRSRRARTCASSPSRWGVPPERVTVLPNPAPRCRGAAAARGAPRVVRLRPARRSSFAGRLTAQKSLDVALGRGAVRRRALVIAGDGDQQPRSRARPSRSACGSRRFLGALPRARCSSSSAPRDASILSSSWENFPHSVVESLAVGTPVIATRSRRRRRGRARRRERPARRARRRGGARRGDRRVLRRRRSCAARLRAAAAPSVADYAPERVYGRLLEHPGRARGRRVTGRVLFVGRTRYRAAARAEPRAQVRRARRRARRCACSRRGAGRRRRRDVPLVRRSAAALDGPRFWLALPVRVAPAAARVPARRRHRAEPVRGGRRAARPRARPRPARGDRRGARRLAHVDAPLRLVARRRSPALADAVGRGRGASRRRVRTVSPFTARPRARARASSPRATSPRSRTSSRSRRRPMPLPDAAGRALRRRARALQEHRRARRGVAARRAARRRATLQLVGDGGRVPTSPRRSCATARTWDRSSRRRSRRALDERPVLVLPSRSEGMGRVLIEAFCRGRAVIGARVGGDPGPRRRRRRRAARAPGDPSALADAIVRCSPTRELAERLGAGARAAAGPWLQTPEDYARRDARARRVTRLVFVTQAVDPDDPVLGATSRCSARSRRASTSSSCSPARSTRALLPDNARGRSFAAASQAARGRATSPRSRRSSHGARCGPRAHVARLRGARRAA